MCLLFISYEFGKRFFAIAALFFVTLGWNLQEMRQLFYVVRNEISDGSNKKTKNFPMDPIVKIAHFGNVMSIDMTLPKSAFL